MSLRHALVAGAFLAGLVVSPCDAVLLDTVSQTASITINADRDDWIGLDSFSPIDGTLEDANWVATTDVDWQRITMAHGEGDGLLYVRMQLNMNGPDFATWPALYNLFIDTDEDTGTGYRGTMPIGADYLIQGGNVYQHVGPGWNWGSPIGGVSYNSAATDVAYSVTRSLLGNPTKFYFVFHGNNAIGSGEDDDLYPNTGNQLDGDYFEYDFKIPEPTNVALFTLGVMVLVFVRRNVNLPLPT